MPIEGSTLIPSLRYRDAHAAIDWLVRVFGFHRAAVYEGPNGTVAHAQLTRGAGMLMLGSAANGGTAARHWIDLEATGGRETVGLYLVADSDTECEALHARAQAEGAEIVQPMHTPEYGGTAFACRDLEGRIWSVGSYDPWAEPTSNSAEGKA